MNGLAALLMVPLLAPPATPSPASPLHDKTDVVVLVNGDYLTCEIKSLKRGKLQVKTDAAGTIDLEWDDVVQLTSRYIFEVELVEGERFWGRLKAPKQEGTIIVDPVEGEEIELQHDGVVYITPIEQTFWEQVDGRLSLGFSFTRASNVSQLSFGFNSTYRTRKHKVDLDLSSITTDQEGNNTTKNQSATLAYTRSTGGRWFAAGQVGAEVIDELGIELRTFLAGGMGRRLIQTTSSEWTVATGLRGNQETPTGGIPGDTTLEAFLSTGYSVFRYDSPQLALDVTLSVFPGLTEWGRVRSNFDTKLRWELISDFFWELTYYANYDNQPPESAVSDIDYGIVTSLGYSF